MLPSDRSARSERASSVTYARVARLRRWLSTWTVARWSILCGTFVVVLVVLAASSGLWTVAEQFRMWWLAPALPILSLSIAVGVAAVVGARGSRAVTLCDLRPLIVALVASSVAVTPIGGETVTTAILSSLGPWGVSVGQPVLALVGVVAPLMTLRDRIEAELAPSSRGDDCSTCMPLPSLAGSRRS